MASADGAEGDIMGHHHPDRRLDAVDVAADRGGIGGGARHGPMMDMIDRVLP